MLFLLLRYYAFLLFLPIFAHAEISLSFHKNRMTQAFAKELEQEKNIPITWIKNQFQSLNIDLLAIELIQKPFEALEWPRYHKAMVSTNRVSKGREFLIKHNSLFNDLERSTRIPKEVVAAIIGIETNYGNTTGKHSALAALATLAFYYSPRAQFFRSEMKELLSAAYENQWNLKQVKSSYAGALGIPQFMPSAVRKYAKGHNETPFDLFHTPEDAIVSVFNYLQKRGQWRQEESQIAHQVSLNTEQTNYLKKHKLNEKDFIKLCDLPKKLFQFQGTERVGIDYKKKSKTPPDEHPVALRRVSTPSGQWQYYLLYQNFLSIMSYNPSGHYAHAVVKLAETLSPKYAFQYKSPA